jgi:hypothetical protein
MGGCGTTLPPAFPSAVKGKTVTVLMEFPNHSYGLAGDLHPTSFEIYKKIYMS